MSNKNPNVPCAPNVPVACAAPTPQFRDRIDDNLNAQTSAHNRLEDAISMLRAKLHGAGKCDPDQSCEPKPEVTMSYLCTRSRDIADRANILAEELYELVNSL